jgi:hypothetical protein
MTDGTSPMAHHGPTLLAKLADQVSHPQSIHTQRDLGPIVCKDFQRRQVRIGHAPVRSAPMAMPDGDQTKQQNNRDKVATRERRREGIHDGYQGQKGVARIIRRRESATA